MASAIIHIAVCNEINKKLKRDNTKILLGSIAPDISKLVGENKVRTHFLTSEKSDIPGIDKFLGIYGDKLTDDFVLGYYIHLYTDYLWFKYFMPEIFDKEKNIIYKLDGTSIKCEPSLIVKYIYNDYTNLNSELVKRYDLDLKFLYDSPSIPNIIVEAHMDKLDVLRAANIKILENSKVNKDYTFNIDMIDSFIKLSVELILANLKEIKVI